MPNMSSTCRKRPPASMTPSSCMHTGTTPVGAPAGTWLRQIQLPDGTNIPALVNGLGFGFAASSYSKDGLAVLQGIQDTKALVNVRHGLNIPLENCSSPAHLKAGPVATKSVESDPSYAGRVAVCGPIGSFQKRINYLGDARVLIDYFSQAFWST